MDAKANSLRKVSEQNAYESKYFHRFIGAEDLDQAALWQANSGRNLSLGDFAKVNIARADVEQSELSDRDCLELTRRVSNGQHPHQGASTS
jgi:hypothetical protein